jgi:SPP1 gp7 family putative phage head morphogenesis protein
VGRRFDEQQTNALVDKWIGTNVDLIESIPPTYLGKVEAMMRKSVNEGLRVEELSDKIMAMGNVAQAHANLIARDQTLKLYGGLNRERQKSVGIEKYIWRGVLDEAEREMHIELEGRVITWGDPPVTNEAGDTNDPGEDYQCRCSAEPIFD